MVLWDVEWVSDCAYYLKYNSGMEDRPKQIQDQLKKHRFLLRFSMFGTLLYFQSTLDKASNPVILKDTLWIKQRTDAKRKVITNPRMNISLPFEKRHSIQSSASRHSYTFSDRVNSSWVERKLYDLFE